MKIFEWNPRFVLQLKFFRMQMSQTMTQQRLLVTFLDWLFNFCMSCTVGKSMRIETTVGLLAQAHGITDLVFSPATSDRVCPRKRSIIVGAGCRFRLDGLSILD